MVRPAIVAVILSLFLVACSGGGSGGGAAVPPSGFTVTGVIQPDALNRVDADTNDPESPTDRNNHPDQAQVVLTPAIIGGFVAAPGTVSRFGAAGDEFDFFDVELRAGQQIILQFPDPSVADLDLYLVNHEGQIIDGSIGLGATETLSAPADGRYFVGVHAFSGHSNYSLRLATDQDPRVESRRGPRLSDDFVPGEMIVRADAGPGKSDAATDLDAQSLGLQAVAGAPDREQLWRIPKGYEELVISVLGVMPGAADTLSWASPGLRERHRTLVAIKGLQRRPGVLDVSPNFRLRAQLLPNDPLHGLQWHHATLDLPDAWSISTGRAPDADVIIAVIDTGVFLDHEDLRTRLVQGYDFISDPNISLDGDGIDPNPDDPGDSTHPGESTWHGTHVAGIAAAESNNAIGVAGISWGARIMPVRTLGKEGLGTQYDTLQGIRWAAGLPNDSETVPARPADVINLSLGGGTFSTIAAALTQEIRDRGIFIIAAAGNRTGTVDFPAAHDAVFAVGATDAINQLAPYSGFGDQLDLVAPGGNMRVDHTGDGYPDGILSTLVDDTSGTRRSAYAFYQGTSMATAVVSGVVSLARSIDPGLTPDTFAFLLESGRLTDDMGPPGWDPETGWGQINALKTLGAVRGLADDGEIPPLLSAAPQRLEFGFTESVLDLLLRNSGGGTLQVTGVSADASWLSVTTQSVDGDGLGTYRVRASRDDMEAREHSASVRIQNDAGPDLVISARLRVAAPELAVDTVGRIYVLLVDETGDAVAAQGVNPEDGRYRFRFDEVPGGRYRIAAGTDMSGDGRICGPGEACGAYPTLSVFESIDVNSDLSDLDFSVGFRSQPDISDLPRDTRQTSDAAP
nr:S8 family serine peptidase [Thioalkalivibrio thiocyanodenitrificans]